MCGIVGHISKDNIESADFVSLVKSLNHRGPDDYGIYETKCDENKVFLGHTRLSIIDLSKNGHQPMYSQCSRYVIVFNGEVYNFKDIKEDLIEKGYSFFSSTDTEVILNGFVEYKEKIFSKIKGMFSIAIYDKQENELFLARDKSGIKPLYYFHDKNNLIFSSEIKILKKYSNTINKDAKILFLLFGYIPEPITIYDNIKILPSGNYAIYKNGKLIFHEFERYEFAPKIIKSEQEIIKDIRSLLDNSIKKHLVSDARVGVFLSGGLDSSVITALSSKYIDNLTTVSLVFEDKNLSEEYYQDLIVDKYNTNHTKYLVTENIFKETFSTFIDSMDQPTVDGYNTFLVSKVSKELGLKVVLSGIGGDEIFYGYSTFHKTNRLKELFSLYKIFIPFLKKINKFKKLEFLNFNSQIRYYLASRGLFTPSEVSELIDVDLSYIYTLLENFLYDNYNIENFELLSNDDITANYELNMYMKNQLLRDSDIFSMINSIELRVPFLDKDLVDYVLKIDSKFKFNGVNKYLLVKATEDLIPLEITNRDKKGFELPYKTWFMNNIDEININPIIKKQFLENKTHWSRVYSLMVLDKFK
ncbi:asparagine synthase (glutamine-hydrolyzing) [Sulfurimonas sp.]|uniref:asparagine synthase (glutamine-hydrolyzing) n=1 Tax=Sulfurimonas sp. TaxID=2022749 RepID=UPI00356619D9